MANGPPRYPPAQGTDDVTVNIRQYVSGQFPVTGNFFSQNWYLMWFPHLADYSVRRFVQFPQAYESEFADSGAYPSLDPGWFTTCAASRAAGNTTNITVNWSWDFQFPVFVATTNQPSQAPTLMSPTPAPFPPSVPLFYQGRCIDGWVTLISNSVPFNSKVNSGSLFAGNMTGFQQTGKVRMTSDVLTSMTIPSTDSVALTPIANGITLQLGPDVLCKLRASLPNGFTNGTYASVPELQGGTLAVYELAQPLPLYSYCGMPANWNLVNYNNGTFGYYNQTPNFDGNFPIYWGGPSDGSMVMKGSGLGGVWITTSMVPIPATSIPFISTQSGVNTQVGGLGEVPGNTASFGPTSLNQNTIFVNPISPSSTPYMEMTFGIQYDGANPAVMTALASSLGSATLSELWSTGPIVVYHLYCQYDDTAINVSTQGVTTFGKFQWQWVTEMVSTVIDGTPPSSYPVATGNYDPALIQNTITTSGYNALPGFGPQIPNPIVQSPQPPAPTFSFTQSLPRPYLSGNTVDVTPMSRLFTCRTSPIQASDSLGTWMGCLVVNMRVSPTYTAPTPFPENIVYPTLVQIRFGSSDGADASSSSPARVAGVQGLVSGQQVLVQGQMELQARPTQGGATYSREAISTEFISSDEMMRVLGVYNLGGPERRVNEGMKFNPLQGFM